jgi:hypothetical protein
MSIRYLRTVLSGVVLACTGCVAVPPPGPYGSYPVAPMAPPQPSAQNCRQFQQSVLINGQPQLTYGTTCQQPDGSWQIVNAPSVAAPPPAMVAAPYPAYPYSYYPGYYYGPPVSVGLGFGFGGRGGRRW